jgi:hypothetical protein
VKHDDIPQRCPICGKPLAYYNREGFAHPGIPTAWYTCDDIFEPDETGAWKPLFQDRLFQDKEQPQQRVGGGAP